MYDFQNPPWRQMMQGTYTIPPNPVPRYQPPASVPAATPATPNPGTTQAAAMTLPWGYKFGPGGMTLDYSQIMGANNPSSPDWSKLLGLMQTGALDQANIMDRSGGYWNGGR